MLVLNAALPPEGTEIHMQWILCSRIGNFNKQTN
jgi:hypothetical protein